MPAPPEPSAGEPEALVRQVWSRWNNGEREADPGLLDPELEIHSQMTGVVYRGYEGMAQWVTEIQEQFDGWSISIDDVTLVAADRVLVTGRIRARGHRSGVDLDQPAAWIARTRDGRLLKLQNFIGHDAADQAAAAL